MLPVLYRLFHREGDLPVDGAGGDGRAHTDPFAPIPTGSDPSVTDEPALAVA